MRMPHTWHKRLLSLLLPLLAATEFVENSAFTFSAGSIADGLPMTPLEFCVLLAAFATGTMLMIAMQQLLSRHWGYRRYLLLSLGLFLCGALGSALSGSWLELVLFRVLEGFSSGALFTSSRILVVQLFARDERPATLRTYIGGLFGMTATGPILAAMLSGYGGWHTTFLAPIPFAALAFVCVYLWLPPGVGLDEKPVRWRATPILVFAGAAFLLQISLAVIRVESPAHVLPTLLLALTGGALLWHFLARQRHHEEPLIRWHGLRHPGYLTGLALYSLYYLLTNANNYLFPVFTEQVLALPLRTVGWLSSFAAGISWLTALLYLRWARHVPRKQWLMAGSCMLLLFSCLWFAHAPVSTTVVYLVPALVAKGMFGSLLVLPLAGFTFRDLSDEHFGSGYQSKNMIRQLAISLGTAASALGVSRLQDSYVPGHENTAWMVRSASHEALRWGVTDMYLLLAAACVCMLVVVLLPKD